MILAYFCQNQKNLATLEANPFDRHAPRKPRHSGRERLHTRAGFGLKATGLCLSCKESFDQEGKILTEGSVLKAFHIVLQEDVHVLPLMKGDKLIGVVWMGDLFHEITNAVLEL